MTLLEHLKEGTTLNTIKICGLDLWTEFVLSFEYSYQNMFDASLLLLHELEVSI